MTQPKRHGSTDIYRYGFQGQEKDDEVKGEGNSVNYTFRMHDPRVGRFFATDPLDWKFPYFSTYQFSGNRVIDAIEFEGLENLVLTQYEWKLDGSKVPLFYGIVKTDGNWKGNRYREAYFFPKNESGFDYYEESGEERNGEAWLKMKKDNPVYFKALHLYHDFQAEKQKRVVGDAVIIAGGLVTTILSGGSGTGPYMAAFGMTSGIFSIGMGSGKLVADLQGDFPKSDALPESLLGAFGQVIDKAQGDKHYYEKIGNVVSALILLKGSKADWTDWTSLKPIDKLNGSMELIKNMNSLLGNELTDEALKKYGKEFTQVMNEYTKIVDANKKKDE